MEHSSTRTISSVIGGSTLTAPLLRIFTLSMMRLLLNVKLLLELLMLLVNMELLLKRSMQLLTILSMKKQLLKLCQPMKQLLLMIQKSDQQEDWEEEGPTGGARHTVNQCNHGVNG